MKCGRSLNHHFKGTLVKKEIVSWGPGETRTKENVKGS